MKILKTNPIIVFCEKINTRIFFLILFLYQVVFIFQGLDFADEGFYPTFYREIFSDPVSVKYNFMYWFSGVVGGLWYKLFGFLGLFGIRLAGAMATTLTMYLSYKLLKNFLKDSWLKLGLLLVILFMNSDPKELYYNNIATVIYMLTVICLFNGLKDQKIFLLFLAGSLVAVNIFTRIPNVLQTGLVFVIFYHGFLHKISFGKQIVHALVFGAGFLTACGLLILTMKMLGHWDLFLNAIEFVFRLGKSETTASQAKNIDISGYYGFMTQVKTFWTKFSKSLRYVLVMIAFIVLLASITPVLKKILRKQIWIYTIFKLLLIAVFVVIVLSGTGIYNNVPNVIVLYFFAGFTLITTLFIVITSNDSDMKVLAVIGSYISITYSIGSGFGLWTSGLYSFWISVPIAINYLFNIEKLEVSSLFSFAGKSLANTNIKLLVSPEQMKTIRNWGLYICILGCFYSALFYPMQDKAGRTELRYPIHNKHLWGIFTTKDRARVVNELLVESSKYIKPGDYVLAYDAIPMVHYMTDTKPFMYNSYLWLYQLDVFKEQLDMALKERKMLPVVISQRVPTNGLRGYSWPNASVDEYEEWNGQRNAVLNEFLQKFKYREVWTNDAFKILIPGS